MVEVPSNIFALDAIDSVDSILEDNRQVTGFPINTDTSFCQQPFSTQLGSQYCQIDGYNSCPWLNPNQLAGAYAGQGEYAALLQALDATQELAQASSNSVHTLIDVTGPVTFLAPGNTLDSVNLQVLKRIERDLPSYWDFKSNFMV